ncbi:MAG: hypothetical protein B7Z15_17040 [Rhizobiales bacterium 32-66-8]|nr:MAG: hypothetical protein B7Z15_17040 [Rhizobiales bacterium 32-66-8]
MRCLKLLTIACALGAGLAPALAKGPGKYTVAGVNADDKSKYEGTTTITKTGENIWRVVSVIDGDKFDGYGIGDEDIISVTFSGNGSTGVALYVSEKDGSYTGIWAFKGDKKVSMETLTAK